MGAMEVDESGKIIEKEKITEPEGGEISKLFDIEKNEKEDLPEPVVSLKSIRTDSKAIVDPPKPDTPTKMPDSVKEKLEKRLEGITAEKKEKPKESLKEV